MPSSTLRAALVAAVALIPLAGAGRSEEPCTDPDDPCVEELLDAFQPHLFFENLGLDGGRLEYPTLFTGADDDTVENNFEQLCSGTDYTVYRNAVRLATAEAACWLLQYHHYYPANWHVDLIVGEGYTHEHDWEWVYVLAGWSWRLQQYIGYAATLSSHDRDNLEAFRRHHTYLFPLIVRDPGQADDWVSDDRRLARWTDDQEALLRRAAVVVSAAGNAHSADLDGGRTLIEVGGPDQIADPPLSWQLGQEGTACTRETEAENCYGDVRVCELPFICSGTEECGDCAANRYVPWRHAGQWNQPCVPETFRFPDDLQTEVDPEPALGTVLDVRAERGRWRVTWYWPHERGLATFELSVATPQIRWRCPIGFLPADDRPVHQVVVLPAGEVRDPREEHGVWFLPSSCLRAPESGGGWLELWGHWDTGERSLLGRSLRPLPRTPVDTPLLRLVPNPTAAACAVRCYLPRRANQTLWIADIIGRCVRTLAQGPAGPGWHTLRWDGRTADGVPVPGGVYWVSVRVDGTEVDRRLMVIR